MAKRRNKSNDFIYILLISMLAIFIYKAVSLARPEDRVAKERAHTVYAIQVVRAYNLALCAEIELYNDTMHGKWSKKKVKKADRLIHNATRIKDDYNKTVRGGY